MADQNQQNGGHQQNNDESLRKGDLPTDQNKEDKQRPETVVPDNDSGDPGAPDPKESSSSNKGQGPKGENL